MESTKKMVVMEDLT